MTTSENKTEVRRERGRFGLIDSINLAGSVASVTGVTLLSLNRAFSEVSLAEILGYLTFALCVVAGLSFIWIIVAASMESLQDAKDRSLTVFVVALGGAIFLAVTAGFVALTLYFTREAFIPFYSFVFGSI
ncbi:MAG: hypothetical protein QNK18_08900 [Gammaproteobacteria bacterium]|nr:hypothetical protein [Gammaproteobacteria bacterium]MDJ0891295.1 hypothetical protein [Gammaproteobacteria bacterium]